MDTFLATNIPDVILASNRFRDSNHRLCEPILREEFAGYWICKGPLNRTETSIGSNKILLHIHGGGYVAGHPLGSLAQFLRVAELAAKAGAPLAIFALQYSLGPQAKIPQQVQEAVAAYLYLLDEMQIPPCNIILEGDSAGGHLVLSLLQELANKTLPRPGGCILIYPWVNLENSGNSFRRNCYKDILTKAGLDHARDQVLGPNSRHKFAHLIDFSSPMLGARSWKDILPRTWVSTGMHDCLVDDIVAVVGNARLDGANVDFQFVAGKPHAWLPFDDAWDIHAYRKLYPSASVGDRMAAARHVYEGLSAILVNSRLDKGMGEVDQEA
jgi:acetyl esterase/lipase